MNANKLVDVVVVSYNSRELLRGCVEPLSADARCNVIVVDNASSDGSLETVSDLPNVVAVARESNIGFGRACNQGWRLGAADYVLFLNPDARLLPDALTVLIDSLQEDSRAGVVGPRILDFDGSLVHSQRHFLDVLAVWAEALYLHHLFPRWSRSDGTIRDPREYDSVATPDWISGACMMLRRETVEELEGFDERFFMYCEDQDLCRRLRERNLAARYEPRAVVRHAGGASAPRAATFDILIESRRRYLAKYHGRFALAVASLGLAVGQLNRIVLTRGGLTDRLGHVRGLRVALAPLR